MMQVNPRDTGSGADPATTGTAAGRESPGDALTILSLVNLVLREWRLVVWPGIVLPVLVAAYLVIRGPEYTARSIFEPQNRGSEISRIAGLAAQFGLNLARPSSGESLDFYAELLRSRELLGAAVQTNYRFAREPGSPDTLSGTLIELFEIRGDTPERRLQAAIDELADRVSVRPNVTANLVALQVTAPWPELASQINRRMLDLIGEFNLEKRQTQARAEREFVGARLQEAERELREAEAELEAFLRQNRRYDQSAQLQFEYGRLQRQVELRQQVYVTLAQAYEQARIEEVRNTPVISVLESPEGSARRRGGRVTKVMAALAVGIMAGLAAALIRDFARRERTRNPADYAEFDTLRRAVITDVVRGRFLSRSRRPPEAAPGSPQPPSYGPVKPEQVGRETPGEPSAP
nr:MAG: hypothetical protein DIU80_04850 [Chloroflexota bacterium]